jgi:hypothetical protein
MGFRSRLDPADEEHPGVSFAMTRDGYIRIHRSMLDWEWYSDEAAKCLFLHLLLSVNWKHGKWRGHDVEPGTMICSIDGLAETMGWTRSKLRHTISKLKKTGEIETTTTNHWTAITLVNWAKYQIHDQQSSQPRSQPTANQQPTNSQPTATIEEGKKERREERVARSRPSTKWTKDEFLAECKKVTEQNENRLPRHERKPFADYWTESDGNGKMRFQAERFFDPGRRMDTWNRRSNKNTFEVTTEDKMSEQKRIRLEIEERYGIEPGGAITKDMVPREQWAVMGMDKMI